MVAPDSFFDSVRPHAKSIRSEIVCGTFFELFATLLCLACRFLQHFYRDKQYNMEATRRASQLVICSGSDGRLMFEARRATVL